MSDPGQIIVVPYVATTMFPHRYWRINITAVNSVAHTVAAILEIQFHAQLSGFGTDVLEGGTASADSINGGTEVPARAVDGIVYDTSGSWGSTNTAFPHWWKYDFGASGAVDVFGVSMIARYNGNDGVGGTVNMMMPKDFSIQWSDDNSTWTTKWSQTGETYLPYQWKHFRAPLVAAYSGSPHGAHAHWRIKLNEDNGGNICSAEEIEMRAAPGGADQCNGGTAFSDGNWTGNADVNAFDNSLSTFFGSTFTNTPANAPAYIGYSFPSAVIVSQIAWRCRATDTGQTPKTLFVQYADSASGPWTTAWGVTPTTSWSLGETRLFTDPNYSGGLLLDLMGSILTGAYSFSRDLKSSFIGVTRYTSSGGVVDTLVDQSGNSRTFTGTTTARPLLSTAGSNSRACADFDGTDDRLISAAAMSAFMSNAAGYMAVSFIIDDITANDANPYGNEPILGDTGGYMGIYIKNTAGSPETVQCFNWTSGANTAESATILIATTYVVEWWHAAGNLYCCVNNGTPVSVASGNTGVTTGQLGFGFAYNGSGNKLDGKIFEAVICSSVPANRSDIAAGMMAWVGAV